MQKSEGKLGKHDTTLLNTAEMKEGEQEKMGDGGKAWQTAKWPYFSKSYFSDYAFRMTLFP